MPPLPVVQRLGIQRDEAADERPPVTDHHALADQRVSAKPVLENGRGNVLAAGRDDELFLPAGYPQEAFVVQRAEVAGVQPAVGVDRLLGGCVVAPVTDRDDAAAQQHLAVLSDLGAHAGERLADRADLVPTRLVDGSCRRRLGQSVALEHGDADAAEEVAEAFAEWRASGYRVANLAADCGAQL